MRPKLRGAEETCEGLDRASALEATEDALAKLSRLWGAWTCPASGHCCQLRVTGRSPWLWPTEWWLLVDALAAQGRALPAPRLDGGCRFLDEAGLRCTVYPSRPSGCRTYFCERGQGPALPGLKTHALFDELAQLNIAVDPDAAPRPIEAWADEASRAEPTDPTGGPVR